MEKGNADGNVDDAERVGPPTPQVVVPLAVVVAVVALVSVAFGVHRKTRQHKKQHPVKLLLRTQMKCNEAATETYKLSL